MDNSEILKQVITGLVITKSCSISADIEAKKDGETKTVYLRFTIDGVTVEQILGKAVATQVIQWQGKARKHTELYEDGQTVDVKFDAPARTPSDPIAVLAAQAKAAGQSIEEYMLAELKRRGMK